LIKYEQKEDLQLNIEGREDLWIKLLDSNLVVSVTYRHPKSNPDVFF